METLYDVEAKTSRNRCCFVPMCTSGYRSNTEKVSLFAAPRDANQRQLWTKAISRSDKELSPRDVVCQKHFSDEEVIREWKSGSISVPYTRPKLKKGAVPSKFPGYPKYLRKKVPSKRKQYSESPNCLERAAVSETNPQDDQDLFFRLYDKTVSVSVPSLAWSVIPLTENGRHYVLISEMSLRLSRPSMEKQVVISQDLAVSLYAGNRLIVNEHIRHLTEKRVGSVEDVEDVLYKFSLLSLCYGGPRLDGRSSGHADAGVVMDSAFNCWRHRRCTLVLANSERCKFCVMLTRVREKKRQGSVDE